MGNQGIRLSQFELRLAGAEGDPLAFIAAGPNGYSTREGAASPLSLSVWHHLVLTADGGRLTLYRDGQAVGNLDYTGDITTATAQCLGIGGILDNTVDPAADPVNIACSHLLEANPGLWTGAIDDVAVWTRTVGADEVLAIYQAGQAGQAVTTIPPVIVISLPPTIAIGLDGKITYTGTLHGSDNAAGPYAPVAGATSPFTPNTAAAAAKFYRSGN